MKSGAEYGKISNQKKDAILQNVRIEKNDKKKDVLDFALWKSAKEGEPSWPSPWGNGRPGWHIECSAMSMKYLGETFDLHGGGRDLIFPHHENEIAQSEAMTGKNFSRYWIHHGLVTIAGHKMSKSLRNYITLDRIEHERGAPGVEELKFLFLGTHYGAPLDYSTEKMDMQKSIREKFLFFFQEAKRYKEKPTSQARLTEFDEGLKEAMDDDFNTPQAITVLHEMMSFARKSGEGSVYQAVFERIIKWTSLLGLSFDLAEPITNDIMQLIREREEAKKNKDFKVADEIRAKLLKQNVILTDLPDGKTDWRIS